MVRLALPLAVAVLIATAAPTLADGRLAGHEVARDWRRLLLEAAETAQRTGYEGEALWASWELDAPRVGLVDVTHPPGGGVIVRPAVTRASGDAQGAPAPGTLRIPLPPAGVAFSAADLDLLVDKYRVAVAGPVHLLGRACALVEVHQRSDGRLREKLWLDEATGLVLRRETYDGEGRLLRLAAFLSLQQGGGRGARSSGPLVARSRSADDGPEIVEVSARGLAALRDAGWVVPAELPGGYRPVATYALTEDAAQPLHLVYSDGLYTVSIFQQRGRADWNSLPPGAEPAKELGWHAYHWPDALPRRLVWEAAGSTFTLVSDASPEELLAIARALPRPQDDGAWVRVRRGLRRLWSWVSPWQ